jgi:hypothetical protein
MHSTSQFLGIKVLDEGFRKVTTYTVFVDHPISKIMVPSLEIIMGGG